MQFIKSLKSEKLTLAAVQALHEVLTEGTMRQEKVGVFRDSTDDVFVENSEGEILHIAPSADLLNERMQKLLDYSNGADKSEFTHPVIRSIILHFMLGYEHPFVDGNGRTARALFYWSMKKHQYWLIEYISLSKEIKAAPVQYGQAYLETESDDGDITYFLINQLKMIKRALMSFQSNLEERVLETREARKFLDASDQFKEKLNFRQLALLKHAIRNSGHRYNINEHKNSHGITYETSRQDLQTMAKLGLLEQSRAGRKFIFTSPQNMNEILQISEDKLGSSSTLHKFFNLRSDGFEV